MKNKILAILLICVLNLSFVMKTDALLSITHFNIGMMIIEELEKDIEKSFENQESKQPDENLSKSGKPDQVIEKNVEIEKLEKNREKDFEVEKLKKADKNIPESEKSEQICKKLSESEKNAFLSGMVYADIGRFYFDKVTGVDSDSEKFAEEMSKFAKTSEEKWFVLGFKVHILQDKETGKVLRGIFGGKSSSYKDYLKRCALLDNYFLQKNKICVLNDSLDNFKLDQIISGINNKLISKILWLMKNILLYLANWQLKNYCSYEEKYFLTLYGDLIRKTYESFGIKVELSDLQVQTNNILAVSAVLATTTGKIIKIDEKSRSLIEKEMQNLSNLCASYLIKNLHSDDYKEKS